MPLCWPRLAGLWKTQVAGALASCYFSYRPGVAELADAADSKSAGALLCVGSTPSSGTLFLRSPASLRVLQFCWAFLRMFRTHGEQERASKSTILPVFALHWIHWIQRSGLRDHTSHTVNLFAVI